LVKLSTGIFGELSSDFLINLKMKLLELKAVYVEPYAKKNRYIILNNPHTLVEGKNIINHFQITKNYFS
jgi:NADH:ubiquinone oxidoreductase subunit F (NADH-binding)